MIKDTKTFEWGDKMIVLTTQEYENEINVDDLLRIDFGNLVGEILTFPVLMNRIGIMNAELEDAIRRSTFKMEEHLDKQKKEKAKAKERALDALKEEGTKSPTIPQVEGRAMNDQQVILLEQEYNQMKYKHIDLQHTKDQINNLYWSCKSKDEKLNKISEKIRPNEFEGEILEGKINGVLIKVNKKLIA